MAGNGNRLFPESDRRLDSADKNGRAENGAVKNCADGAVRALPHFLKIIFLNALRIRSYCCALYADMIFFAGLARVNADLIVRFVSVPETEVVVFGIQLNKRKKKLVLNHLPDDSCHFVSVHFDNLVHFNLAHYKYLALY